MSGKDKCKIHLLLAFTSEDSEENFHLSNFLLTFIVGRFFSVVICFSVVCISVIYYCKIDAS